MIEIQNLSPLLENTKIELVMLKHMNRALIKSRYKDTAGAIKDAKTAVLLKPHLTHIWQLLSSPLSVWTTKMTQSSDESALEIEPENTALMIQLGKLFGADNRPNEAA